MNVSKKLVLFMLAAMTVLLSACGGEPSEKIHNNLEKSVEIESKAGEKQDAIIKLEKKEKVIYDKLIALGDKDMKDIQKLSDDAITNIDKRKDLIDEEKDSMDESKKNFEEIKGQIDKLETDKEKSRAKKMYKTMENRFSIYNKLNKAYLKSLTEEKKMYKLLAQKDATHEQVSSQIKEVNTTYEKLIETNKDFNAKTKAYNDEKKAFYQATDLDVSYNNQKEK